jgi:hypothetical protein
VIASSHVLVFSFWWKVPKGYMALEQFFVSARTIKRHHHLPVSIVVSWVISTHTQTRIRTPTEEIFLRRRVRLDIRMVSSSLQSFFSFFASQSLHNRKKLKKKSGDANDKANFSFFFLLHKRAKPFTPPLPYPSPPRALSLCLNRVFDSTNPILPPYLLPPSPPICPYLGNVAKLIRRRRISLKRDNHPKNPSVKSMAPLAPRECNQPARSALHRKQSAHRAAQRTARMQPTRVQRIVSHPVQCSALHHILCSTAHRANAISEGFCSPPGPC